MKKNAQKKLVASLIGLIIVLIAGALVAYALMNGFGGDERPDIDQALVDEITEIGLPADLLETGVLFDAITVTAADYTGIRGTLVDSYLVPLDQGELYGQTRTYGLSETPLVHSMFLSEDPLVVNQVQTNQQRTGELIETTTAIMMSDIQPGDIVFVGYQPTVTNEQPIAISIDHISNPSDYLK